MEAMKTKQLILIVLTVTLLAGLAWAAPYVELNNGQKVMGTAIRALANGDINLTMEMGVRTFPKGSYLKAVADKPPEFDKAVAAMKAQKYDESAKLLEEIIRQYRNLGWDVEAGKVLPQVLLAKGDAEGAVTAYGTLFLADPEQKKNSDVAWGLRNAMMQAKQYPALLRQLDAVAAAGSRLDAARAQNMRGDIQLAQNNVELAALEYLRTAILFTDVRDPMIQGEAHYKAAAALEQLRDPRAKEMYQLVVQKFGASPYAAKARGKI
jgi:tetratricopeptide (TPR) repeat protein